MKKMIVVFAWFISTQLLAMEPVDGAVVLSVFHENGVRKVLISEENVQGSPFYQTYEGWGGSFDASLDNNALDTASREFWEEALADHTLGLSLHDAKEYLRSDAVEVVIKTSGVSKFFPRKGLEVVKPIFIYIVEFSPEQVSNICERFFERLKELAPTEENFRFREKGNLAIVAWKDFVHAISKPNREFGTAVSALVYNKDMQTAPCQKEIKLRSILVGCLHNHFLAHEQPVKDGSIYEYQCHLRESS